MEASNKELVKLLDQVLASENQLSQQSRASLLKIRSHLIHRSDRKLMKKVIDILIRWIMNNDLDDFGEYFSNDE